MVWEVIGLRAESIVLTMLMVASVHKHMDVH